MASPRRPNKETTAHREREAWRLRCRGWSQQRIADHLGITQPSVNAILKRVEAREAKRHAEDYDRIKIQVDGQLAHIQEEASDAWHQSKEPLRRVRQTTDPEGNEQTVTELVEREGNVAYIDRVLETIDRRMKLWGLNVNAADQEISSSVASIAASIAARGVKYEQSQAQEGHPEGPAPAAPSGAGEVQDRPGPVQ